MMEEHKKEIMAEDAFSYDGYQVVRGEFFAHIKEPSITFTNHKVSLNAACLNLLPNVNYVQMLVNSKELKLAVCPSGEDEKDSFRWCTMGEKRKPKQITCHILFAKIVDMMGWNPEYRYKLLGKLVRSGDACLFTFDLKATESYKRSLHDGEDAKAVSTPIFPVEWRNQFGTSVEEHRKQPQVNIFKGYTVFNINEGGYNDRI